MKIITISLIVFTLVGCTNYTTERKVKIVYNDNTTEIITMKKHSSVTGNPVLFGGCLYRRKHQGQFIGESSSYIGAVRCNVKYFKTISVKTYKRTEKPSSTDDKQ